MTIQQYIVDAFANQVFQGNQAAICCTDEQLNEALMQSIAIENNFSETAFLVPLEPIASDGDALRYSLRWFTPGGEIDLCGHATLASAFVVSNFLNPGAKQVTFVTQKSGELPILMNENAITMNMPAYHPHQIEVTDAMERAFGVRPTEAWLDRDLICFLPTEDDVRKANPDDTILLELEGQGIAITAKATDYDFVSRFFAPELAVHEDPVTGSAHCALAPLWADKLNKEEFDAFQASSRGGELYCVVEGDRVMMSGKAVLYAKSELFV